MSTRVLAHSDYQRVSPIQNVANHNATLPNPGNLRFVKSLESGTLSLNSPLILCVRPELRVLFRLLTHVLHRP